MFRPPFYHRPENLWKDFVVESKAETTNPRGRTKESYGSPSIPIKAILCGANPDQQEKYHQMGHPISHVISHEGEPVAKAGDRLVMKDRMFYVQGVDNPGDQGIWTLYYAQERFDAHDSRQLGGD